MRKETIQKGFTGFSLTSALIISAITVSASELPRDTVKKMEEIQIQTDETEGTLIENEENVDAGTYDKTAPIIKNLTLNTAKAGYQEDVVVTAEITDDLSGVQYGYIVFKNTETGDNFSVSLLKENEDTYVGKTKVDEFTNSGLYEFNGIHIADNVGNLAAYSINYSSDLNSWEGELVAEEYLKTLKFEIENDHVEEKIAVKPEIKSLEIIGDTNIKAPGVIELVADATSEQEITYFCVNIGTSALFSKTYTDYKTGKEIEYPDGKWHAEISIDEHFKSGDYSVAEVTIFDKAGNEYFSYSYTNMPASSSPMPENCKISYTVDGADVKCDENVLYLGSNVTTVYTSDGYTAKNIADSTKHTKDFLAELKETGKSVIYTDSTLSHCNNSFQLIFSGNKITGEPRDIDLNVERYILATSKRKQAEEIREQVGDTPAYVLDFSDKEEFPGSVTVRFRDSKHNSYRSLREYLGTEGLCLYEYKDGEMNLVAEELSIAKDNYYEFETNHGATYVVTAGKVAAPSTDKQGEEFASNEGNTFTQDETGAVRCYDEATGEPVINDFKCDGTYTYYFQADGTAMQDRLTYHPDGEHVIYFDSNGHEVFSNFANVKKTIAGETVDDYCFFDVHGYLYVDVVTYDQAGKELYYANPYGVLERGKWFQFSESVKCADGNPWPGAAGNYGYANADGTLMVNQYTYDWEGRYCYLQGNGAAKY